MGLAEDVGRFADEVLRPGALEVDRTQVPAGHLSALRELGALRRADRRLHEIISGACFNTWLVWAQHAFLLPLLTDGPIAGRALAGEVLLGAAASDIRHYPRRFLRATRVPGGWRIDGTVSWVSGWGLNRALLIAAVEEGTGTVVSALAAVDGAMEASPLRLSVVTGSRTFRVRLRGVFASDENVVSVQPFERWLVTDIASTCDTRPYYFGLAAEVLRELAGEPGAGARRVASVWGPRVEELRVTAYGMADEAVADPERNRAARLEVKVAAGEALSTLTRALVVARSGRGLTGEDTAQLHARSAMFALVQAQSAEVRDAQLAHLAR